jgi:hypothetical protein
MPVSDLNIQRYAIYCGKPVARTGSSWCAEHEGAAIGSRHSPNVQGARLGPAQRGAFSVRLLGRFEPGKSAGVRHGDEKDPVDLAVGPTELDGHAEQLSCLGW